MTDSNAAELMRLLTAKWYPPVIGVLADLGIADHLVDGPRPAGELAAAVGAHPGALHRLLRAAVSIGLFTHDGSGNFGLSPMSEHLRSDRPGSLRPAAVMFAMEPFWSPYGRIRHSVLTGEPAFDQLHGMSIYQYLSENPDQAATFGAAAAAFHAQAVTQIAISHDFSRYGTVVDVGGGTGSLLAAILRAHPAVRGVLFDRPDVIAKAYETFEQEKLTDRIELVSGDFFESVPSGDALLIKSCLHNFSDAEATEILRVMRRATPPEATLLVAETVVPSGDGPHYSKLDDIEMLVIAGGADRDEQEYTRLLTAGGFSLQSVTPCGERFSLLEARPAG
ncbi:methyltransferase domain-containing protein [Herbidospora galbida]|uniref:Methyltransferase domain-containing protein n=1 Tax=Herbidospora galbida TaxID=2575442 RepID=A0A4U3MSJ7_9ACTN|nr:methyltransferase [Herbidospora galbida]TKK91427.1 methyltransferase domain-containing protein [Herbidospora galbida]